MACFLTPIIYVINLKSKAIIDPKRQEMSGYGQRYIYLF